MGFLWIILFLALMFTVSPWFALGIVLIIFLSSL